MHAVHAYIHIQEMFYVQTQNVSCVHACILPGIANVTGDAPVLQGCLRKAELVRCRCPCNRIIRDVAAIVTSNEPSDISLCLNVVPDPPTQTGNHFLPLTAGITFCYVTNNHLFYLFIIYLWQPVGQKYF